MEFPITISYLNFMNETINFLITSAVEENVVTSLTQNSLICVITFETLFYC
jgi:hypothetical protein